ncbi:hypothetical protein SKAU_G00355010 [Synaphobranchus kaupii]|uniref:long-chain-fatty-acid--CoA ligase n=1 Tax=Synaphobranchus kaupii TaxID=118154 RepID=A0A9Q1IFJ2_SYNKA|nr:hypothetical protein SKAU_G00355010 [Synaphobranchus kaupii]
MIAWVLTTAAAGLLALVVFQIIVYPYFWDDLIYHLTLRKIQLMTTLRMKNGVITFLDCFVDQARKIPKKPFIVFEDQVLTYQYVDRRSNKVGQVFRTVGRVKKGDTVALLMSNEPDFICVWFGLCKLGCEVAFLNFNLKSKSLLHCIETCGAKILVVGSDLVSSLAEVLNTLQDNGIDLWVVDSNTSYQGMTTLLDKTETASDEPPPVDRSPQTDITSTFLFIFTSGTTGLPKAARDRVYLSLPLYHMSASLLGIGGCIELGATCVLKNKFSASQFWKDCQRHDVTVFQYVGELCRYLVNQPKVAEESAHRVRIAVGSGLRTDVWREFSRRFGKVRVRESYGLTEANVGFLNYTREVGPIGRAGFFNKRRLPFELLKYDPVTYEPVRNDAGHCVQANKGETGILVAPVTAMNPFLGYAGNKTLSEKKLLRGVFKEGDVYFNTGDLMLQDYRDFLYFRDRIGDTFRWKGENVATTEVSEILGSVEFLQEVNVYGVSVPGYEGRAGMAAVVLKPDQTLDGKKLYSHLVENLPAYSWPRFLRVQSCLDVTETFKQQKGRLVQEGFSPLHVQEPLYFLEASEKTYIPLTESIYDSIVTGQIRL